MAVCGWFYKMIFLNFIVAKVGLRTFSVLDAPIRMEDLKYFI